MAKHRSPQPSKQDLIRDCAREVCELLAKEYGSSYATSDVIYGFTAFLQVVISILQKSYDVTCEKGGKVAEKPD